MSSSWAMLAHWIVACAVAATLGTSFGYVSVAPGLPRLVADALVVVALQALALGKAVRRLAWIGVTI